VDDPCIAERAAVLFLLSPGRDERWSLAELQTEAFDVVPSVLSAALRRLQRHGVVVRCDDEYVAARSAWHLDWLGMVSI
jgi:DNA-binding HxlR family transcriptional regulator